MGSKYYGNETSGGLSSSSSTSSSRKGKKNASEKPKQPQRGLGVAQLEKIRLHTQLGCTYLHNPPYASGYTQEDVVRLQTPHSSSSSFSYSSSSPTYGFQGVMMGLADLDRANMTYGDSQSNGVARLHPGFVEPSMTRSLLEPAVQDFQSNKLDPRGDSAESQEIDLELRLSL